MKHLYMTSLCVAIVAFLAVESRVVSATGYQSWSEVRHAVAGGSNLAWQGLNGVTNNWDIYFWNLNEKVISRASSSTGNEVNPHVSEDYVVWQDDRNGQWDIYAYEIATGQEIRVTTNIAEQRCPLISENTIIWEDVRNGNWDIYAYDLTTQSEIQITSHPTDQLSPAIHGSKVVWQDMRNGNWDIYMYDIASASETRITTDVSDQLTPDVYDQFVVWEDRRYDEGDIAFWSQSNGLEWPGLKAGRQGVPTAYRYAEPSDSHPEVICLDFASGDLMINTAEPSTSWGSWLPDWVPVLPDILDGIHGLISHSGFDAIDTGDGCQLVPYAWCTHTIGYTKIEKDPDTGKPILIETGEVPEPSALLLLAVGGLVLFRRRKE